MAYCGSKHLTLAHAWVAHYEHMHVGTRASMQRACTDHIYIGLYIGMPPVSHGAAALCIMPHCVLCVAWRAACGVRRAACGVRRAACRLHR